MTYTYKVDERGRQVLLNAVKLVRDAAAEPIVNGDFSEETLSTHEELYLLHRGLLYIRPDPEPEPPLERPLEDDAYDPQKVSNNIVAHPD